MLNFFKVFGKGILYIVGLPFILAFLALYAIYCLVMFLYMAVRNLIIFFSGGTLNGDLKEDIEARKILLARQEKQDAVNDLLLRAYNAQPINSQPTVSSFETFNKTTNQPAETKEEISDDNINQTN